MAVQTLPIKRAIILDKTSHHSVFSDTDFVDIFEVKD
jgi:hypothetical protein